MSLHNNNITMNMDGRKITDADDERLDNTF